MIPELKQSIFDKVVAIDEGLRRRVYDNFLKRLRAFFDVNGSYLPDEVVKEIILKCLLNTC